MLMGNDINVNCRGWSIVSLVDPPKLKSLQGWHGTLHTNQVSRVFRESRPTTYDVWDQLVNSWLNSTPGHTRTAEHTW
jgi:hypothetical protein